VIVQTYIEIDITLDAVTTTYRFTYPQVETAFDSIPALEGVSITPQVLDSGVSMGMRASVRVQLRDFLYPFEGTDYSAGSFFGKLRARRRSLQGFALRVIRGEEGQLLSEMVTEHYVVESLTRSGEQVTIVAKDLLKLADGDRSQAPNVSRGRVLDDISDADTAFTLNPAGIGDLDYPSSGKIAIGGSEVCGFTRVGDVMTITRAQSGTDASAHEADELVQLVLIFDGESPADIIYDLLTQYTDVDPDWCPLSEWQDDIDTYVARLYSAEIVEPTPVQELINEIISQVGLVMYWDGIAQRIELRTLRPMVSDRYLLADEIIQESFRAEEQPAKRVSEVWTYFGLRDAFKDVDSPNSFRSVLVTVDATALEDYGQPAIRKVFSRWIVLNNRPAASRLNSMLLARYRDPPRKFSISLPRMSTEPKLGDIFNIGHWSMQDEDGNEATTLAQFTSIEKTEDTYKCTAEEMLFNSAPGETPDDGDVDQVERVIFIDASVFNLNLKTLHDSLYAAAESGDTVTCIIAATAVVGSLSVDDYAFDVGDWPVGVLITITVNGRIQGKGGDGAINTLDGDAVPGIFIGRSAQDGGPALYTRFPVTVVNNGQIYGGGGGGGYQDYTTGGGLSFHPDFRDGGGGSGSTPGLPNGTADAGGPPETIAATYGYGGGPGEPGAEGRPGSVGPDPGGAAGVAVDGDSFVTFTPAGTIAGARIN
jgi:hypothetical protein